MHKVNARKLKIDRRRAKIRPKVLGTLTEPRLSVFRSNKYIYAQLVDDAKSNTLLSVLTAGLSKGTKSAQAEEAGVILAKKAVELGIKKVKFDRNGYKYHGRVKSFADAVRKGGLQL